MIRLFTYLTMVNELPTAMGTYFDPVLADVDSSPYPNFVVSAVRNGTGVLIHDPAAMVDTEGSLILGKGTVDLESGQAYVGSTRYLGSCLAYHFHNHLPIAIFKQSSFGSAEKAYVAFLSSIDETLNAAAIDDDTVPLYLTRMNQVDSMSIGLIISRDGIFTDIDDIASAIWNAR